MEKRIRVGIAGYGNLGRGVEAAISLNDDMELISVFTRRDPRSVELLDQTVPVRALAEASSFTDEIDVMILCGGSKNDLPEQTPQLSSLFNTIDSFDTHAKIPEHFAAVDETAKKAGKVAIISAGWDPGLFSVNRLMGEAILPAGETYTFWGKGLSQGHSDALRRIEGVKGAVQYTIPVDTAVDRVRSGEQPELSTREKHTRECFVVLEEGADAKKIEQDIIAMPDYFSDYDTTVNFITEEELTRNHSAMPHGGFVIRSGKTAEQNGHVMEFSLSLDSNPEFTSSVLVAYARAAYRLHEKGESGAKTVFDIAPGLLSQKSAAELRKELL